MRLDQERLDSFQARMSEWVSKQGFLFQLRHSGKVRGARGHAFGTLLQLVVRLLVLGLLVAVGFWIYLLKRVDTDSFRERLDKEMTTALACEDLVVKGVQRQRGSLELGVVNAIGGDEVFFEDLEMRGFRMLMGLADGILTPWRSEAVNIQSLTLRLKSGADNDEEASRAYQSLFRESDNFKIRTMQVSQANLQWGYSESNRGHIVGARMTAARREGAWHVVLKGGHFSQNWLRRLPIERIEAELRPDGWIIHEARLLQGEGQFGFTLKLVEGGAVPRFEGSGVFQGLPLAPFLEPEYREFVDGEISGAFDVRGSTNSQAGFEMLFEVSLDREDDSVVLRDRLPVLRAISTADRFRSYKKVRFRAGSFQMYTGEGNLRLADMKLKAPRQMHLEGDLLFRGPTEDEVAADLEIEERNPVGILTGDVEEEAVEDTDAFTFSLRQAAEDGKEDDIDAEERLSSIIMDARVSRDLGDEARRRQQEVRRVDGTVRMGVVPSALDKTPELSEAFPVDEEQDLRWITIEVQGAKVFELTEPEAERIFALSRKQS